MDPFDLCDLPPDDASPEAIFKFGMSFNAHEYWGDFDRASEIAKKPKKEDLAELRTELFMKCRASRHRQDDLFIETYQRIRPEIVRLLVANGSKAP